MSQTVEAKQDIPELAGSYELLKVIGRGAGSLVHLAQPIKRFAADGIEVPNNVALKVFNPGTKDPLTPITRTEREVAALVLSRHENVIGLYDYHLSPELCYLALEHAERGDFRQLIEEYDINLAPEIALALTAQILSGLDAIHRAGIVHRDIKPENILLAADGSVRITDFGICLLPGESQVTEDLSRSSGTFDYLAPEFLEGGVSNSRTDLYSVGIVCYQLLAHAFPFEGKAVTERIEKKMKGEHIPLRHFKPDAPESLEAIIAKAIDPNPEKRFQSAVEFCEALQLYIFESGGTNNRRIKVYVNAEVEESTLEVKTPTLELTKIEVETIAPATVEAPVVETASVETIPEAAPLSETEIEVEEAAPAPAIEIIEKKREVSLVTAPPPLPPARANESAANEDEETPRKAPRPRLRFFGKPRFIEQTRVLRAAAILSLLVAAGMTYDQVSASFTGVLKPTPAPAAKATRERAAAWSLGETVASYLPAGLKTSNSGSPEGSELPPLLAALSSGDFAGTLYKFDGKKKGAKLSLRGNGTAVTISVELPGWKPQEIDLKAAATARALAVTNGTRTVSFQFDPSSDAQSVIRGRYYDSATKKTGTFVIWPDNTL